MHGDFFNGWVNGTIPDLLENCPQPEYGNQDVGECPQYEQNTTPRSECKLKNYYKEKVETPGTNLICCNPISLLDPAPKLPVALLGTSTDSCGSEASILSSNRPPFRIPDDHLARASTNLKSSSSSCIDASLLSLNA